MAITRVVDKSIIAAFAVDVIAAPKTIERVAPGRSVNGVGSGRAGLFLRDEVSARPRRAVRKVDALNAIIAVVQFVAELDLVARNAVGQKQIVSIARHFHIARVDAGPQLQHASSTTAFLNIQMAITGIVDERVVAALADEFIVSAITVERVAAGRTIDSVIPGRPSFFPCDKVGARPRRAIGEVDRLHTVAAVFQLVIEFDLIAGDPVGQEETVSVAGHLCVARINTGAELQHAGGAVTFGDLQMTIARVVHEGVVAAFAVFVIVATLAIEDVRPVGPVKVVVTRCTSGCHIGELQRGELRAIREFDILDAILISGTSIKSRAIQKPVQLNHIARRAVMENNVAGAVLANREIVRRDACAQLENIICCGIGVDFVDFELTIAGVIDERVVAAIALFVIVATLAVDRIRPRRSIEAVIAGRARRSQRNNLSTIQGGSNRRRQFVVSRHARH